MYSSMTSFTEHHAIIDFLKPGVLRISRVTGLVWDNVVGMINTVHQANAAMGAFVPLSEKGPIFRNLVEIERSCHVLSPEGDSEPKLGKFQRLSPHSKRAKKVSRFEEIRNNPFGLYADCRSFHKVEFQNSIDSPVDRNPTAESE
jgi:hypothetical protein